LVSAALLLHLTAIFVTPCAVGGGSLLFGGMWEFFQPYLQATYLDHGFHFFAPEPGPSHLVRYEITRPDGTTTGGYFPNPKAHWSRLRNHRHFMLTEHLNGHLENGAPPELIQSYARSYARHLLSEADGQRIKLFLMRHRFPSPREVLEGKRLNDPSLYFERPLGTFEESSAGLIAQYPPDLTDGPPDLQSLPVSGTPRESQRTPQQARRETEPGSPLQLPSLR